MTVNVYRVTASGASVATIYQATAVSSGATSRPRVYAVNVAAAVSYPTIYRLTAVSSGTAVTPIVDSIPPRTVDGWDTVTITPTANPTPDAWIYTVLAGGVTLDGSGASRTFTAPALFDGTTVRVGVQASKSGVVSAQQVGVYTVKPWNSFILTGTPAVSAAVDGGTATAVVSDVIDGGGTTNPTDVIDGGTGSSTGTTWIPRRPIQIIGPLPPDSAPLGVASLGSAPLGG